MTQRVYRLLSVLLFVIVIGLVPPIKHDVLAATPDSMESIVGSESGHVYYYTQILDAEGHVITQWYDHNHQPIRRATMLERERAAYWAKNGNFDAGLIAALATTPDDALLSVVLWLRDDLAPRQPVIDAINALTSQPYQFEVGTGAPTLATQMVKRDLLAIQWLTSIDRIYSITRIPVPPQPLLDSTQESDRTPTMLSALTTEYIPPLWVAGFRGAGRKIGIVELGNLEPMPSLDLQGVQPACNGLPIDRHATAVANIAAGDSNLPGVAPDASLLSACAVSDADAQAALTWVFDQGADVANISLSLEGSPDLGLMDRVVDYTARDRNKLIVVAAGNQGGFVGTPAKAWNAVSVGGFEDHDTHSWIGDVMLDENGIKSAYQNPQKGPMVWEKPEVSAVGVVRAYANPNEAPIWGGTSVAAPQVTGLAALVQSMHPNLPQWPEAVKAILMASAIHNIQDSSFIPPDSPIDLRDGAGAIVGILARETAGTGGEWGNWFPCSDSCWWGSDANATNFPVGATMGSRFWATKGDRIRVVVSWSANASETYHYGIVTDLNLVVRDPNFTVVGRSHSLYHTYEIVDVIAQETGLYRFEVTNVDTAEASYRFGVAATMHKPTRFVQTMTIPMIKK